MERIRINRYLSMAGVCSRRQADEYLDEGRVTVNGRVAQKGDAAGDGDEVMFDGRAVKLPSGPDVWLALNKPAGYVCSRNGQGRKTVYDIEGIPDKLYYVGRLDADTTGLLLFTDNGAAANELARAANMHEKEYTAEINKPVTADFLKKMSGGVEILGTVTRRCICERTGKYSFRIVITQGLNRQIRRMCEACGARVVALRRVRFCSVVLGDMKEGEVRRLTAAEEAEIRAQYLPKKHLAEKKYLE